MRRFFSDQPISGPRFLLTGDQAHHLLSVGRLRPGESLILFDGTGGEYHARLLASSSRAASLEILSHDPDDRLPTASLTLACAIPRAHHMDVLVHMTTELGVASLLPMLTSRSVVQGGPGKLDHWRRIIVESCKQSGRNRLMALSAPADFSAVLRDRRSDLNFILSTAPGASPLADLLSRFPSASGPSVSLLVGPEGGFTSEELDAAHHSGFLPASLTPSILRVETAAVAAASLVLLTIH